MKTTGTKLFLSMFLLLSPLLAKADMADVYQEMGLPLHEGCSVRILPTAQEKFYDMFDAIRHARSYIYMDYYKFQQDSICDAMFTLLRQKVAQGVDVRILHDSFGNRNSDKPLTKTFMLEQCQAGIAMEEFDPVRFPWINHLLHRDHHKICIIDGEVVYTGGMNVADYYLHGKPDIGHWRDMHIRMAGPIVNDYLGVFVRMWQYETGDVLFPPAPSAAYPLANALRWDVHKVKVAFADRLPSVTPEMMRHAYIAAIDNAQKLIQIVNPYPTLFGTVREALRQALARGVRIQFMLSTKTDGTPNMDVAGIEMRKLMERGAEVYYYEGGFHHSKVMMIDGQFCTVGTTNLDARSLSFDYEVNAFIFDPSVTARLQQIFDDDMQKRCTLLTPDEWKQRFPARRRIRARMYMLLKRFL